MVGGEVCCNLWCGVGRGGWCWRGVRGGGAWGGGRVLLVAFCWWLCREEGGREVGILGGGGDKL